MSAYEGLENAIRTLRDLRAKKLQEVAEIDSAIADIEAEMKRLPRETGATADRPSQPMLDDILRP